METFGYKSKILELISEAIETLEKRHNIIRVDIQDDETWQYITGTGMR